MDFCFDLCPIAGESREMTTLEKSRQTFVELTHYPQSILLSVPILIILNGVSTDGRYIGGTFMIFVLSMSTIGLIMLPKVLAFYGIYGSKTAKRGARGNPVKVSGLAASSNQDPNANALREQISSNQDSRRLDEEEKAPEERLTGSSGVEP